MTSGKSTIEKQIVQEINRLLRRERRSKKWLACELGMDYGKVKRVLNPTARQQLSLTVADKILRLLGSSLTDVISKVVVTALIDDVQKYLYRRYVS